MRGVIIPVLGAPGGALSYSMYNIHCVAETSAGKGNQTLLNQPSDISQAMSVQRNHPVTVHPVGDSPSSGAETAESRINWQNGYMVETRITSFLYMRGFPAPTRLKDADKQGLPHRNNVKYYTFGACTKPCHMSIKYWIMILASAGLIGIVGCGKPPYRVLKWENVRPTKVPPQVDSVFLHPSSRSPIIISLNNGHASSYLIESSAPEMKHYYMLTIGQDTFLQAKNKHFPPVVLLGNQLYQQNLNGDIFTALYK